MINKSKETRVLELEQRRVATDLKKDYCSCRCHQPTIFDCYKISDKTVLRFVEILKSFKYQKPDGTWTDEFEKLQERIKSRPPCTCKCKH